MISELTFVLVGTTHSGNIGAAARAIKNMGFSELRLVDCCSHLTKDALARASGADGILQDATRFATLDEAVADCQSVIGTSARDRHLSVPVVSCREVAETWASQSANTGAEHNSENAKRVKTAIVFGRERSGLTNEEMDRCIQFAKSWCGGASGSVRMRASIEQR